MQLSKLMKDNLEKAEEQELTSSNNLLLQVGNALKSLPADKVANIGNLVKLKNAIYGYSKEATSEERGHKCHNITICKGVTYRFKSNVDLGACYLCSSNSISSADRLQQIAVSVTANQVAEFTAEYDCEYVSFYWASAGSLTFISVSATSAITDKGDVAYVGTTANLEATAKGWKVFEQKICKGAKYSLTCNVSAGVSTICSLDNSSDTGSVHRIETFTTSLLNGGVLEFVPTKEANYIAVYFAGAGSLDFKQVHTIATCEKSINDINDRIEVLKISSLNYEGNVIPSSNTNQSFYGINGISLKNGRSYSIGFQVSANVTNGNYITIKISNADGSTYNQIGALMAAEVPSLVPGKMYGFEFVANEDVENIKIGSYTNSAIMAGVEFSFYCTDITEVVNRDSNEDASNASTFYPKFYAKEIAQLKKDSDVVFAFVSDLHHASVNFQRVIDSAVAIGANAVLNGGDTVNNLNGEGLDWYNTIVNDSSVPVLTILGNHDCWESSSPWVWSSAEANYNLIMPTMISQAGVTAPANKSYWYKDFGNLRVIGLDGIDYNMDNAHHYDETQHSWFVSILADSKTNGKKVLVMNHYPFDKANVEKIEKGWNSWDTYLENYRQWDNLYTPTNAINAVKSFIDDGGSFVGWFVGHQHRDSTLMNTTDNRQYMRIISSGAYNKHTDSAYYNNVKDRRYDCFDLVGIDLTHGLVKMLRCGLDEDSSMQIRKPFTWDFVNHRIF